MSLLYTYVAVLLLAPPLLLWLLWWGHLRFWKWRLEETPEYGLVQELHLPDGGVIELRRLAGPDVRGEDVPVLLVHGLAMSHRNHDSTRDASFARFLEERGRDVWLLTLRSGRLHRSWLGPRNATFRAMAEHDLPRAVEAVLEHTSAAQLDLGVFSMGGMLVYASLDRSLNPARVRRVVVFGSPAKIRPLGAIAWSRRIPRALTLTTPIRVWTRTMAFAPRWVSQLLWGHLYNPHNLDRRVERSMLFNVWADIPGQLGADFVRWSGRDVSIDGTPVVEGLSQVTVPVCFFAGAADWLAPEWSVRAGYEAWGRAHRECPKHFVVLGRAHGTRHDYGHGDIAMGRHAREEVFAPAAHFLVTGTLPRSRPRVSDAVETATPSPANPRSTPWRARRGCAPPCAANGHPCPETATEKAR